MQTHGIEIPNPTQKKNGANYKTAKKHIFFNFNFNIIIDIKYNFYTKTMRKVANY